MTDDEANWIIAMWMGDRQDKRTTRPRQDAWWWVWHGDSFLHLKPAPYSTDWNHAMLALKQMRDLLPPSDQGDDVSGIGAAWCKYISSQHEPDSMLYAVLKAGCQRTAHACAKALVKEYG